ncbi:MAG: hypothetical protein FWE22_02200 [Firmicutes bacterium]|nr:hypothetical protein [Bacillota bacterium]
MGFLDWLLGSKTKERAKGYREDLKNKGRKGSNELSATQASYRVGYIKATTDLKKEVDTSKNISLKNKISKRNRQLDDSFYGPLQPQIKYSDAEKAEYYFKRSKDKSLSAKQRKHALKRHEQLDEKMYDFDMH